MQIQKSLYKAQKAKNLLKKNNFFQLVFDSKKLNLEN